MHKHYVITYAASNGLIYTFKHGRQNVLLLPVVTNMTPTFGQAQRLPTSSEYQLTYITI